MSKSKDQTMELPSVHYEQEYRKQGIELIAGIDEVGMGAWAGPVCAAAVMIDSSENTNFIKKAQSTNKTQGKTEQEQVIIIKDSKLMTAKQREKAAAWIKENALAWAVGEASAEEIDELNIRRASHLAMERAVNNLKIKPELLLVDGTPAQPHPLIPAVNIIKGDQLCWSIAAASIVAKVYRDQIMTELYEQFPVYGWVNNKGYGSPAHKIALTEEGATSHHRKSYEPVARVL